MREKTLRKSLSEKDNCGNCKFAETPKIKGVSMTNLPYVICCHGKSVENVYKYQICDAYEKRQQVSE